YLGTYTADHPKMRELDQEIQEVNNALNQEISAIVSQEAPSNNAAQQALLTSKFTNEALVAAEEGKQTALHQIESQSNQELAQLPGKEQGYIRLKRDANVAQDIYVMLAKKLEEAKVAEAMAPNDVQVVDQPTLPDHPIAPRKGLIMLLAALVGFVLSSIGAIAYDIFTKKITTGQEAESIVGLPVLGQVPRVVGPDADLEESQWARKLRHVKEALWKQ
ncbi:MAG: chain-length determining protein, partial [Veillonella sp.]|nr:chain-length determining protein [Veillonella sp.]